MMVCYPERTLYYLCLWMEPKMSRLGEIIFRAALRLGRPISLLSYNGLVAYF